MNNTTLEFKTSPVFTKNYNAFIDPNIRFIINQGGSRSSKTYSICQLILWYAMTQANKTASVCRKTGPALSRTVYADFVSLLNDSGLSGYVKQNKSSGSFLFPNKSIVRFFSVDNPQKLRGMKHDFVFMNEANELTYEEFTQINMRTTGKILLDWNPSDPFSWVLDIKKDTKAIEIHSTYKDNPFLEKSMVREIEMLIKNNPVAYQIYALGLLPLSEDVIFPKLHYSEFPTDLDYIYGMDFGFVDPSVIVKVAINDGRLFIKEEIFESNLTTEELIMIMEEKKISKEHMIHADSARPDQIKSIANKGFSIRNSNKKIQEGLDWMKSLEIHIDPTSKKTIQEFVSYSYKKVHGVVTENPVDANNHCFVGETLITTINGKVPIRDIQSGDMVLTSQGYKKVLERWDNGIMDVKRYILKGDGFEVELISTPHHLIKTDIGWIKISQLKKGLKVNLNKPSAILTVVLCSVEEKEMRRSDLVYDLHIQNVHEYFANDLLVSNSIDSVRYAAISLKKSKGTSFYVA